MVGGQEKPWSLQFFQRHRIFTNFNVLSENSRTFTVGNGKGFESYRKIFGCSPLTLQEPQRPFWLGSKTTLYWVVERGKWKQ